MPSSTPVELQVRISVAQDVTRDADAWSREHAIEAVVVDLSVPEIGSVSMRDGDEATRFAAAVRRAIVRAQRSQPQRLPSRVFFAGPVSLALFIGAELNALGEVSLMDFVKDSGSYLESFRLFPGN